MQNFLNNHTVQQLLEKAKEAGIKGRHKMKKGELVNALIKHNSPTKSKTNYIENTEVGMLVAFKVNEKKALSGKIEEIKSNKFIVRTKKGVLFSVLKKNILWVKTTDRWPKGIYLALKGEMGVNENRRPD